MTAMPSWLIATPGSDPSLDAHSRRVYQYAVGLTSALGVSQAALIDAIAQAALVHDIGKMAIPRHILDKRGSLTRDEFEQIKRHVDIGAAMLKELSVDRRVIPIVRSHHENWDGTGYLRGLGGRRIPLGARIVSVVDCFDALTSDRPYRRRMPAAAALHIVQGRRGTMYDPSVVDAFVRFCDHITPLGDIDDFDRN
jgi:putative nucleotidyltransferase with HDIG domain